MSKNEKRFECDVCHKKFFRNKNLKNHLKIHSSVARQKVKPYHCDICGKGFMLNKSLHSHKVNIHIRPQRHECGYCKKTFSQAGNLRIHIRIHTGVKPYGCHLCGEKFRRKDTLTFHVAKHSGEEKNKCDLCPASFLTSEDLQKHTKMHKHNLKSGVNDIFTSGKKQFECNVCSRKFSLVFNLNNHRKKHSRFFPFACEICGNLFSQVQCLLQHKTDDHIQKACQFCGRIFENEKLLKSHLETIEGVENYECEFCNIVYMCVTDLLKHLKLCHTCDKPYICNVCTVRFSESGQFHEHLKTHKIVEEIPTIEDCIKKYVPVQKSSFEKNVTCKICGKMFESMQGYYGHKRKHLREGLLEPKLKKPIKPDGNVKEDENSNESEKSDRSYKCDLCHKRFKSLAGLDNHSLIHAKMKIKKKTSAGFLTSAMRHKCKECGGGFPSAASLFRHYKTHRTENVTVKQEKLSETDEESQVFENTDITKKNITKTHNEEEPKKINKEMSFTCYICDKSFISVKSLNGHFKVHSQTRNHCKHKCHYCGKKFANQSHLFRHIQIHSGDKPYKCKICDKAFGRIDVLKNHRKLKHT